MSECNPRPEEGNQLTCLCEPRENRCVTGINKLEVGEGKAWRAQKARWLERQGGGFRKGPLLAWERKYQLPYMFMNGLDK